MARIRTIKPEFWSNEDLSDISEPATLLAIGLLNYADDEGYFNANESLIKAFVFPLRKPSRNLSGLLQELININYIQIHQVGKKSIGQIVNFKKHQRVDKPKVSEYKLVIDHSKTNPRAIQEPSTKHLGTVPEASQEEGKGRERNGKEGKGEKEPPPTISFSYPDEKQVVEYFLENGFTENSARKAFKYYNDAGWSDGKGNKVINWKQKMQSVWFKEEDKIKKRGFVA